MARGQGGLKWWLLVLLVAAAPDSARCDSVRTPVDAVRAALADGQSLPPARQPYARYLSAHFAPEAERADYARATSFLINSLSRERAIAPVAVVAEGGLLRVLLDDYGIDPKAWDKLAATGSGPQATQTPEPYFQTRLVQIVDQYEDQERVKRVPIRDNYGRTYWREQKTTERVRVGSSKNFVLAAAPWLHAEGIAALQTLTQSQTPVVRADWWLANASIAPGYYDLLSLGARVEDFEALAFADRKLAERARSQTQGAVTFSSVALHNRALERTPTVSGYLGGYLWRSLDAAKSTDDRDFVNVLLDQRFDATEQIASLPNGLQAYFLTDGKGARLDVAVAGVAIDNETTLADKQVYTARNCMVCHARGMRAIQDEVRSLTWGQVSLLVVDRFQAKRVKDLYFTADLSQIVAHDGQLFEAALKATNGLTGAENGSLFERLLKRYLDEPVTPERLAAEAGVSVEVLLAALKQEHVPELLRVRLDHSLVGLIAGRPARRDQIERSFGQLMLLLGGGR